MKQHAAKSGGKVSGTGGPAIPKTETGAPLAPSVQQSANAAMEPNPAWLLLDNQLCFSAYALSREIISLYRPHLERLGLTYTQYITLMVMWEMREVSMKVLGERLFLDSGTLTPLLKKLVHLGLVEKERDPEDERSVLVRLTDKGAALRTEALSIPAEILCGTGLDVEAAIHLREIMKKMACDIRSQHD